MVEQNKIPEVAKYNASIRERFPIGSLVWRSKTDHSKSGEVAGFISSVDQKDGKLTDAIVDNVQYVGETPPWALGERNNGIWPVEEIVSKPS